MYSDFLEVVPGTIPTKNLHQLLLGAVSPRPIAFASTISRDGRPNLSPFSFFNVFSANPPILVFSPARRVRDNSTKDTLTNVYEVPEVVINVVPYALIHQSNLASAEYPSGIDEFTKSGLTALASKKIRPFRVAESPVQMECSVEEVKPLSASAGAGNLIICKVQMMHISKSILKADDLIDPNKIDLAARMSENFWCRASGDAIFPVEKPLHTAAAGVDSLPQSVRNSHILSGSDLGKLGNVEVMPGADEIKQFLENEGSSIIQSIKSLDELHKTAKKLLENGYKANALKLLIAASPLFA